MALRIIRRTSAPVLVAVLACIGHAATPGASAQAPASVAGLTELTIPRLIADLAAPEYQAREAATRALSQLRVRPEEIARHAPPATEMTVEQWDRLDSILRTRFAATPRAGLGVGFAQAPEADKPGVVLGQVMPAFPASAVLLPGDTILSADGVALPGPQLGVEMFKACIVSHDPGDTIRLVLLRTPDKGGAAQRLELAAPLGSFDELAQNAPIPSNTLDSAWRLRRDRMGLVPPETPEIATTLKDEDLGWPNAAFSLRHLTGYNIIAGGHSAGALGDRAARSRLSAGGLNAGRTRRNVAPNQVLIMPDGRRFDLNPADEVRRQSIRDLREEIRLHSENYRLSFEKSRDPRLTESQRNMYLRAMQEAEARLVRLQEQLAHFADQP